MDPCIQLFDYRDGFLFRQRDHTQGRAPFLWKFLLEDYPLEQELRAFYETEIGDYGAFVEWEARLLGCVISRANSFTRA